MSVQLEEGKSIVITDEEWVDEGSYETFLSRFFDKDRARVILKASGTRGLVPSAFRCVVLLSKCLYDGFVKLQKTVKSNKEAIADLTERLDALGGKPEKPKEVDLPPVNKEPEPTPLPVADTEKPEESLLEVEQVVEPPPVNTAPKKRGRKPGGKNKRK